MKIHEIFDQPGIILSNQENGFVKKHSQQILIASLSEHDQWTAQQLIRKGVYFLTNDSKTMILNIGRVDE